MNDNGFNWRSNAGVEMFAREWKGDAPIKAVLVLVHGLGEHSGRYQHVAEFFVAKGVAILAFDQQGHGKSGRRRGHASFESMMDDIDYMLKEAADRYPNCPAFLYGHSMGGCLVLCHAARRNPKIAGLISTAPALATAAPVPGWQMMLARIMNALYPAFVMDNGLDLDGLSRDTMVVDAYRRDPLVHPWVSARLGLDIITYGKWMFENPALIRYPTLLMQGSADRIVSPSATYQFSVGLDGMCSYKAWEGLYHELHNEPEKLAVMDAIFDWLVKYM